MIARTENRCRLFERADRLDAEAAKLRAAGKLKQADQRKAKANYWRTNARKVQAAAEAMLRH